MTPLEELLGTKLVSCTGDEICTSTLSTKKQIILYFSAHWCPPCRGFTPKLSEAYEEYITKSSSTSSTSSSSESDLETEVIFISSDSDEKTCAEYHAEMTFPTTIFDPIRSQELGKKFGVNGIPCMVAIDPQGNPINNDDESIDMRALIVEHGAAAFPLTPSRIIELKSEAVAKSATSLKELYDGTVPFIVNSKQGENITINNLLEQHDYVGILLGDGDWSDGAYTTTEDIVKKINIDKSNTFKTIYLGWSLYNNDCDHKKASSTFDYSINEIPDILRSALKNITAGKVAPPMMITLRRGTGLCSISGECEAEGVPVVISLDHGLGNLRYFGSSAFPWDNATISKIVERKKAHIESLKAKLPNMGFLKDTEGKCQVLVGKDLNGSNDVNTILDVGEDGVIGLYFSAHWCPPCQRFTPMLVKCYEELKGAGKKFQIIFISSDNSKDEFEKYFNNSMVTSQGDQFLAIDFDQRELKNDLSAMFNIDGIPSLVLLKQDGTIISEDGTALIASLGATSYPWDEESIEKGEKAMKDAAEKALNEALQQEKENEKIQKDSNCVVVKRLIGDPTNVQHNVSDKTLTFNVFTTMGVPELYKTSGVIYYEMNVLNGDDGIPQFGFSLKDGMVVEEGSDLNNDGDGVGDNDKSWALDGHRCIKFHNGEEEWQCSWGTGHIIGLAANIDKGMIAISKDGNWINGDGLGVVFQNDSIKDGVYPCLSAANYKVRYAFSTDDFKYSPPPSSVWDVTT